MANLQPAAQTSALLSNTRKQHHPSGGACVNWPFAFLPPHDQQFPSVDISFMPPDFPALVPKSNFSNNSNLFFPLMNEVTAAAAFPPQLFALDGSSSNSVFSNEMQRLEAVASLLPPGGASTWGYQLGEGALAHDAHPCAWSRGVGLGHRSDLFGVPLLPPVSHPTVHVGLDGAVPTRAIGTVGNPDVFPDRLHGSCSNLHASADSCLLDWAVCAKTDNDNDSNTGDGANSQLSLVSASCVSSTIATFPAVDQTRRCDAATQQHVGSVSPVCVSASSSAAGASRIPSSPSVSSAGSSFSCTPPSSAVPSHPVSAKKRRQPAKKPVPQREGPKRRTHLSRQQRDYMVALFDRNHMPDTLQLREAAGVVGMTLRHAQYWFQNRRSAMRKRGLLEPVEL
ncbi:hypothetical protein HDU82_001922 [Entophlyctis luteolus]|nr:hypothetical protein HDU82_001922 [Entophlyctis luteolus]